MYIIAHGTISLAGKWLKENCDKLDYERDCPESKNEENIHVRIYMHHVYMYISHCTARP